MKMESFNKLDTDAEEKYLKWIEKNPEGWVINTYNIIGTKSSYGVIHRSKCHTIREHNGYEKGEFTQRQYQKICSNEISEIEGWARDNLDLEKKNISSRYCRICCDGEKPKNVDNHEDNKEHLKERVYEKEIEPITKEFIEKCCQEFLNDKIVSMHENRITQLIKEFPKNVDLDAIERKVNLINRLYNTHLREIKAVAKHILDLKPDKSIEEGCPDIVDKIAKVEINGKTRVNYSFATKYCSWHNPKDYPIYDSIVRDFLYDEMKRSKFSHFNKGDLKNYETFKAVLEKFINFYKLEGMGFKKIDMALWIYGRTHPKKSKGSII